MIEEIEGQDEPVVMVHDYHLYTLPELVRRARPDVFLHHFVHIPWTQPDAWRVLPNRIREEIYRGHPRQRHHRLPHARLPAQLPAVLPRPDGPRRSTSTQGVVHFEDREVWVRAYPLPIDAEAIQHAARARRASREFEQELLRRRREHLILRVDRADLSKNVLRGFSAFDLFLEQHPEFRERVTFIAQLMPSRTDVPEYAEYLERIEALVAVVNHRHGTPDWMPIQLKLRDDLEEAVAAYKHYDVLLVNAMFDGMNLVAKEGPIVNERDGVSILSENTGAHEELGEYALSVNPFDIQELADSIHAALTMRPEERARRAAGAEGDRHRARPGRLDRRAARGHPREGRRGRVARSAWARTRRASASAGRGAGAVATGAWAGRAGVAGAAARAARRAPARAARRARAGGPVRSRRRGARWPTARGAAGRGLGARRACASRRGRGCRSPRLAARRGGWPRAAPAPLGRGGRRPTGARSRRQRGGAAPGAARRRRAPSTAGERARRRATFAPAHAARSRGIGSHARQ